MRRHFNEYQKQTEKIDFAHRRLVLVASTARAQNTTQVQVAVGAESSITVTTGTTALANGGTAFAAYVGTTSFTYMVRTSETGGSGTVTVLFSSDLTSSPNTISVATNLTYSCANTTSPASGTSTPCNAGTAASKSAGTSVLSFSTGTHSPDGSTAGANVNWSLKDNPSYKTGT
jgi:hypothetical protein